MAILSQWKLIEPDLHQFYGIDIRDGSMRSRSWRWLKVRIEGLFGVEHSRLRLHFHPPKKQSRRR